MYYLCAEEPCPYYIILYGPLVQQLTPLAFGFECANYKPAQKLDPS